jgi:hypothetical protein
MLHDERDGDDVEDVTQEIEMDYSDDDIPDTKSRSLSDDDINDLI